MAKKYINISATADIGLCIQYIGVLQGTPLHLVKSTVEYCTPTYCNYCATRKCC
jgi:hypothetical protein